MIHVASGFSRTFSEWTSMHKECPLCGETMRVREAETRDHIAGAGALTPRMGREWICPECDYFEELDEESARGN